MPSFRDIFPNRWLKPEIIGRSAVAVTIEYARTEELYNPTAKKNETKLVIKFVGKDLRLICNKTQCLTLANLTGTEDYSKWQGHRVRLTTGRAPNGKDTIVIGAAGGSAPPPAQAQTPPPEITPETDDDLWDIDTPEDTEVGARPQDEDENFYPDNQSTGELFGARPGADMENPRVPPGRGQGVTPEKSSARPPANDESATCIFCHAPAGKPHASKCPTRSEASARPEMLVSDDVALLNADGKVIGQHTNVAARPVEADDFEDRVYARVTTMYNSDIPWNKATSEFVRKCRNADSDSAMKMDYKFFAALVTLLRSSLPCEEYEAHMLLAAILGYRVGTLKGQKPGQLVHGYLVKPLRDKSKVAMDALAELLELCQYIWEEENSMEGVTE